MGVWRTRKLTHVERMMQLRKVPLWADANLDAVAELARHIEELRIAQGEVLWDIGEPAAFSFRIDFGKVTCENAEGEKVQVGAGFLLGSLDAMAADKRSYRATADSQLIALRMESARLFAILEMHPGLAGQMRALLARQLLDG
jgi:CRP-like cAMP-binding protein